MSNSESITVAASSDQTAVRPWQFTPLLYFMQAIPVTLVQETSSVVFKSLGVDNANITFWVSTIALPWSLQMLLGPFVDLNGSKRNWVLIGQAVIALGLIGTAFAIQLPNFFGFSIGVLAITAIFSALCNIATDGYYIIALNKEQQAKFVGLNSTFYRLGRLFCTGALVFLAGSMMRVPSVNVDVTNGQVVLLKPPAVKGAEPEEVVRSSVHFIIKDEHLQSADGGLNTKPEIKVPPLTEEVQISPNGEVFAKKFGGSPESIGQLTIVSEPGLQPALQVEKGAGKAIHPQVAWGITFVLCVVIYGLGRLILPRTMPKPADDVAKPFDRALTTKTLIDTLLVIGLFLSIVIGLGNVVKFIGDGIANVTNQLPVIGDIQGWKLAQDAKLQEGYWFAGMLALTLAGIWLVRMRLQKTEMGEAFSSFIRQPGFMAILGFIVFYRFGEAMVGRIAPLFYQDPTSKGGLALSVEQVGIVNGVIGVLGIILGGIAGGVVVSKLGLRKAFWPLAVMMHAPNLLYVWAAYAKPVFAGEPDLLHLIASPISVIVFVDQFGYGFGFAAYMVYLMWVAQRGNFRTAHYAIGTGMGALCIVMAGIFSGIIQKNYGYLNFFITVMFCTIPGMLMLLAIPLDEKQGRDIQVTEVGE